VTLAADNSYPQQRRGTIPTRCRSALPENHRLNGVMLRAVPCVTAYRADRHQRRPLRGLRWAFHIPVTTANGGPALAMGRPYFERRYAIGQNSYQANHAETISAYRCVLNITGHVKHYLPELLATHRLMAQACVLSTSRFFARTHVHLAHAVLQAASLTYTLPV